MSAAKIGEIKELAKGFFSYKLLSAGWAEVRRSNAIFIDAPFKSGTLIWLLSTKLNGAILIQFITFQKCIHITVVVNLPLHFQHAHVFGILQKF